MSLYLVGQVIDAKRAHLRAQAGELVKLARGVYVDASDDVDAAAMGHAVRIANYLYPAAYLASASAMLLGLTAEGRLFISGRRNQRTRLRTLEIIQNQAPKQPSVVTAIVGDDLGELRIPASSPRQRFLEAFRLRSEHATAINEMMRRQMAARLIEEYGTPAAAADALWSLARENGCYREGEGAERYLRERPGGVPPVNKAALDLIVTWHRQPLGRLAHDGYEWRWTAGKKPSPPLVRETTPGKLPPFIESLLPEGWLARVLRERDEREALRHGKRYMSNIAIVANARELDPLPDDVLHGALDRFQQHGAFTGTYQGPGRGALEERFDQKLAQIFARAETPRLSGVQIKAPMFLDTDGTLRPATDAPFTHILKPAGTGGFEMLPVVEWFCLELGRAIGFVTPNVALAPMPDAMPPALVVERFDIRRDADDQRGLALEDFCSILDVPATAKYDGTIERMARGLRPLSTDPAADIAILYRRALFAWLIADGDMHLKNLALLKIAEPGARSFASVRFAPLYDAVTTRIFPNLAHDRMALKLAGKDNRLTSRDFAQLARTIELPSGEASAIVAETAARALDEVARIALPPFMRAFAAAEPMIDSIRALVSERAQAFV
jgi:serine/threonine-protein kinase HipA